MVFFLVIFSAFACYLNSPPLLSLFLFIAHASLCNSLWKVAQNSHPYVEKLLSRVLSFSMSIFSKLMYCFTLLVQLNNQDWCHGQFRYRNQMDDYFGWFLSLNSLLLCANFSNWYWVRERNMNSPCNKIQFRICIYMPLNLVEFMKTRAKNIRQIYRIVQIILPIS